MPVKKLLPIITEMFGPKKANEIQSRASYTFEQLRCIANGETKSRKKNILENILPFIALYRALQDCGLSQRAALETMYSVTDQYTRNGMRKTYEKAGKLPFFFPLFRKMFTTGLQGGSWEVTFLESDAEHFFYDITKCLWHDVCTQLGCPELCPIFCHNDEINFVDVTPRLHFRRSQTLGEGGSCCDFRFYRHDPDANTAAARKGN